MIFIGPPEACIIAGYRDNGETLVGWNFFQDMPEYAGIIKKDPCGYFQRSGWFGHADTMAVIAIGAWAEALLNDAEFPRQAPLPLLMERLMCQIDAMTMKNNGW